MDFLKIFEWVAVIIVICSSIGLSTKLLSEKNALVLWLIANTSFAIMFLITKQYGFLVLNLIQAMIDTIGIKRWGSEKEGSPVLTKFLYIIVGLLSTIGVILFLNFILNYSDIDKSINVIKMELASKSLEWSGTLVGIAGAIMLVLKNKYSRFCWFFWLFANSFILMYTILFSHQYGVMVQQIFFTITNFIGIYHVLHSWTMNKYKDNT